MSGSNQISDIDQKVPDSQDPNFPKILVIGDVHIQISNLPEIDLFLKKIKDILEKEKPDFVVSLGDNLHYHEKIMARALYKVNEFINMIAEVCPIVVIVGNHERINNSDFLSDIHPYQAFNDKKNVTIVNKVKQMKWSIKGLTEVKDKSDLPLNEFYFFFTFVPYVPCGRFMEALNTSAVDFKDSRIIFAHQEFKGSKLNDLIESTSGDTWDHKFPWVISGHIHVKQKMKNVYYPGSPIQHTFNEPDDKGVLIVEGYEDTVLHSFRDIILDLPKKITIQTTPDKFLTVIVSEKDKYRIVICGKKEEFIQIRKLPFYRELIRKGVKITFKLIKSEIQTNNQKEKRPLRTFKDIMNETLKDQKMKDLYDKYLTGV